MTAQQILIHILYTFIYHTENIAIVAFHFTYTVHVVLNDISHYTCDLPLQTYQNPLLKTYRLCKKDMCNQI